MGISNKSTKATRKGVEEVKASVSDLEARRQGRGMVEWYVQIECEMFI
jgi:hypothetical protein